MPTNTCEMSGMRKRNDQTNGRLYYVCKDKCRLISNDSEFSFIKILNIPYYVEVHLKNLITANSSQKALIRECLHVFTTWCNFVLQLAKHQDLETGDCEARARICPLKCGKPVSNLLF